MPESTPNPKAPAPIPQAPFGHPEPTSAPPEVVSRTSGHVRAGAITPEEWALCLDCLRREGPDAARCLIARGRVMACNGKPARSRTLVDKISLEPFKTEWAEALAEFVSKFSNFIHESAVTPEVTERYDRTTGQLIERRTSRRDANWAALMVLRRYSAEWRERKAVNVDGTIQHEHSVGCAPDVYRLSGADVLKLEPAEQEQLFILLERVEAQRAASGGNTLELIEQPKQLPTNQD